MTRVNAKAISVHLCLFVFVLYQNHQMQLVTLMWGVVCGIGWGLGGCFHSGDGDGGNVALSSCL